MNKIIALCLLSFMSFNVLGQIGVGTEVAITRNPYAIKEPEFESFKATTTLFVYRNADKPQLEDFKKAIKEVWTVTPIDFIEYSSLQSYLQKPGYSYLMLSHNRWQTDTKAGVSFYLGLFAPQGEKEKFKARALYFLSMGTSAQGEKDYDDFIYNKAVIENWKSGMIATALRRIDNVLKDSRKLSPYASEQNATELAALKQDTLFIPDFCVKTTSGEPLELKKLMADYPFPYKVISSDVLNNKILTSSKPVYYLMFTRTSKAYAPEGAGAFLSIFNSKSSAVAYSTTESAYNYLRPAHFNAIAKAIKKAP